MECTRIYMCGKNCAAIRLQSFALSAATLILVCLTMLPAARAETVLTRKRVGNNSEGVTYVTSGHWKNRVVAIDGNDVLAINLGGPDDSSKDSLESENPNDVLRGPGWKKIFDVLALGTHAFHAAFCSCLGRTNSSSAVSERLTSSTPTNSATR
jgi:hypothetical protein